jgi:hypothetical protein
MTKHLTQLWLLILLLNTSLWAQHSNETLSGNWEALIGPGGGYGTNAPVNAIAVSGNDIFIGGSFTQVNVNGTVLNANHIARFNTQTNTWSTLGLGGNGVNGTVNALVIDGNFLYVGGSFTQANVGGPTVSVSNLARFNLSTSTWQSVGGGVSGHVYALAVSGNNLFVGGSFLIAGGSTITQSIARLNLSNNTWSALGSVGQLQGGQVYTLAIDGDTLFVGGNFSTDNNSYFNAIASVNWQTNQWAKLGSGTGNGVGNTNSFLPPFVQVIALSGDTLFVGGRFERANQGGAPVTANNLAMFRRSTNAWSPILSGTFNGVGGVWNTVRALFHDRQNLWVGGIFSNAGSISANRIAKYNLVSQTWSAVGTAASNGVGGVIGIPDPTNTPNVHAIAKVGNDLYICGYFLRANEGVAAIDVNHIARYRNGVPNSAHTQAVSANGTFTFPTTGVSINFSGVTGSGFCTVERYDNPASNLAFSSTPPLNTSPYRFIITQSGFSFSSAELRMNRTQIPNAGIANAQTVDVYRRATPNSGTFSVLPNTFNASFPDEVRATTTAFSEFILGSNDANNQLPVEWIEFSARKTNEGVTLLWKTASELNNAGFEVQRKSNNKWNALGFVRGAGTTTDAQSYTFIDRTASGKIQYRLKQIDFDGQFEYSNIIEVDAGLPTQFSLEQNYPNPFNPTTLLVYQIPISSEVKLEVYDMLGRKVATLVNAFMEAGIHTYSFDASRFALTSGIYFYRIQAGGFVATKKMVLLK